MSEITLTINGKEAKGQQGDTILAACERAGSLSHAVPPEGRA